MSKLIYSKEIEKREEIVSKPLEHSRVLAITIITVLSISFLIAVSFCIKWAIAQVFILGHMYYARMMS
jgi:hypothetical protein